MSLRKTQPKPIDSNEGKTGARDDDDNDMEEKSILISNVFEEIRNQEAALSTDKYSSAIIEKVLKHATEKQLIQFDVIQEYFLFLSSNRYSSHVLQTYLSLLGNRMEAYNGDESKMLKVSTTDQIERRDRLCWLSRSQ